MSFGFSAETAAANAAAATQAAMRRESHVPSVNVTPTSHDLATGVYSCLFRYIWSFSICIIALNQNQTRM